jgi:hypothetical protein
VVYLSLLLAAEVQGNPHGLVEFNRVRLEKLGNITRNRQRKTGKRVTVALMVSFVAVVIAVLSLSLALWVYVQTTMS